MSASWFYGAPVTKLVVFSTAATTAWCLKVAAAPDLFLRAASLDTSRVLASGELWRLVTCHIPFATVAQLLFGLPFLYEMRKLERMMGTGKFGVFFVFVTSLATSLQAGISYSLFSGSALLAASSEHGGSGPATGPFSLIYAMLMLHHVMVPALKSRQFRILGVDFTNKAPFYLMAIPVSGEFLFLVAPTTFLPSFLPF